MNHKLLNTYQETIKMKKLIPKLVYFPILGLIFGIILFFSNSKIYDKILQEKHAIIWMLVSHIMSAEIIIFILLINHYLG